VNLSTDALQAADVHRRIDSSSQKFLNATIALAGYVPKDDAVARGASRSIPFVRGEPAASASQALDKLASTLVPATSQARIA